MFMWKIELAGAVPGVVAKEWARIRTEAWPALGDCWHQKFRERHFTKGAAQLYGYAQRKGEGTSGKKFWRSYTGRKQKKWGHTRPLVFSGLSLVLTRKRNYSITKTQITIRLPTGFNRRNKHSNVNMRDEITTVLPQESNAMINAFYGRIADGLRQLSGWGGKPQAMAYAHGLEKTAGVNIYGGIGAGSVSGAA